MILGTGKSTKQERSAFTLLEVTLALFIVMLIVGIALPLANGMNRENVLREPADELKTMAQTARRAAITERKTYEIILENDRYLLRALPAGEKEQAEIHEDQILQRTELRRDVHYVVRRWDEKDFGTRTDSQWRFPPTGICEPLTVKFAKGADWLQFSFNPLTATAEDETFFFP